MLRLVRAHCCPLCSLWTLGLFLLLAGVTLYGVLHPYIASRIRSGLLAYSVLSSPSAGQWKGFVDSRDPSGPAVVSVFYFYNCTNPAEVLNGGKPNLATVGPLTYTYVNTKHNISWDANGDEIVYTEYQRFFAACVLSAHGAASCGKCGKRTRHTHRTLPLTPTRTTLPTQR